MQRFQERDSLTINWTLFPTSVQHSQDTKNATSENHTKRVCLHPDGTGYFEMSIPIHCTRFQDG